MTSNLGTPAAGDGARPRRALVTGAAAGIGRATVRALVAEGYRVFGIDRSPSVAQAADSPRYTGLACDVTREEDVTRALERAGGSAGALSLLVCNAGIFTAGRNIEDLDDATWDLSLAVNLTGTLRVMRRAIPLLKNGRDASIVVVGSRNAAAPGPGAAAYSVAKAGVTQLARVAALELAADGVRVNVLHPDAVFDTELWTPEALARSAARYGLSVDDYKRRNLMKTEILSTDVAAMICAMAGPAFAKTTGSQVTLDGGNDRVI